MVERMEGNFTTTPPELDGVEWIDFRTLEKKFGIKRSLGYELISRSAITSKVLRKHGCVRGKRIISCESVRQYIEALPDDVHPAMSAICKKANRAMQQSQRAKREKETAAK